MNTSGNITDLPLEVLGLIFEEIPSLEDRLCLAQAHPNIGFAFSYHYGQRFKKLDMTDDKMLSVLLPLCGSSVEQISNTSPLETTEWILVEKHCPNLQFIKIYVSENNINCIKSFLANVRSLSSMTLHSTFVLKKPSGIDELLKFQTNLKRLNFFSRSGEEILEVRDMVNLENLLIRCYDDYIDIHELCHRLKKLRTLNIKSQVFASKEFDGVPCPALKELHLLDFLRGVPKFFSQSVLSDIIKWILSHAERLEILTLCIAPKDYKSEKDIYQILSKCKNLRFFCMPMSRADTNFAHRVAKIVSENGVSEERQLDLNFYNPIIHDDIQKAMANFSDKQLITFNGYKYVQVKYSLK